MCPFRDPLSKAILPLARTIFSSSKPLLKKAAKSVGREALNVGVSTLNDIASGANVKESLKKNVKDGGMRVSGNAKNTVKKAHIKENVSKRKAQNTGIVKPAKKISRKKKKGPGKTIFD